MFEQDTELSELRETIEVLKVKNEEAQADIQGALNNPDNMKGMSSRFYLCSTMDNLHYNGSYLRALLT